MPNQRECLKTDLKCVNGWSSSTVQWKRVPKFRISNRVSMSMSVAAEISPPWSNYLHKTYESFRELHVRDVVSYHITFYS